VPISFAVSVCPHVTTQELLNGFSWNLTLESFTKTFDTLQFWFRTDNYGHFTWRQ
jgi:hypothetical protein